VVGIGAPEILPPVLDPVSPDSARPAWLPLLETRPVILPSSIGD